MKTTIIIFIGVLMLINCKFDIVQPNELNQDIKTDTIYIDSTRF